MIFRKRKVRIPTGMRSKCVSGWWIWVSSSYSCSISWSLVVKNLQLICCDPDWQEIPHIYPNCELDFCSPTSLVERIHIQFKHISSPFRAAQLSSTLVRWCCGAMAVVRTGTNQVMKAPGWFDMIWSSTDEMRQIWSDLPWYSDIFWLVVWGIF